MTGMNGTITTHNTWRAIGQGTKNSTLFVVQEFYSQTAHERRANTNGETRLLSEFSEAM